MGAYAFRLWLRSPVPVRQVLDTVGGRNPNWQIMRRLRVGAYLLAAEAHT